MKVVLAILLIISVAFNLYQMDSEVTVKNTLVSECEKPQDKINITQAAVKKKTVKKTLSPEENLAEIEVSQVEKPDSLTPPTSGKTNEELAAAYEKDYKKGQKQWREEVSKYMIEDLGLNAQYLDDYLEIREGREQEISEYLAPFFEKSKNDEAYFLSTEDTVSIAKINDFYLTKLKESMGDKAYNEFSKFKRSYNKKMVKEGKGHYFIEF